MGIGVGFSWREKCAGAKEGVYVLFPPSPLTDPSEVWSFILFVWGGFGFQTQTRIDRACKEDIFAIIGYFVT